MPSNIVNLELKSENIPGGYPTTPKSDQIERDSTPILEFKPPQDPNRLSSTNNIGPMTENPTHESNDVQQETIGSPVGVVNYEISEIHNPVLPNAVSREPHSHGFNVAEKITSDNKENDDEVGKNKDSNNRISSTPSSLSKDSIPFDLNGDYNIDSSSAENDSTGDCAMGHHMTPIKTSPESLTSQDESPHYTTPTDIITNDPLPIDHNKNVTNVMYTVKEISPDGNVDSDKQLDHDDHSSPKVTKKDKVSAKIGTLKIKIGKLIKKW